MNRKEHSKSIGRRFFDMLFTKVRRNYPVAERAAEYFGMTGPTELLAATIFAALLIIINVLSVLHQHFNSDEPAHAHIMWAWTQGQIQYRDVFSNNMPLFHLLFAPLLGLLGERANILYWMRFLLLPTYFVTAWCTYKIGARLFSRRAGIWAAIVLSLYGAYRNYAFQFRADNLWTVFWLLGVLVLLQGTMDFRRAVVAGLLCGFCFALSMKSAVLLIALSLSALITFIGTRPHKIEISWQDRARDATAFFGATALPPVVIMIFFALNGVWRDFRYGVFDYNFLAERLYQNEVLYHSHTTYALVVFLLALVAGFYIGRWITRSSPDVHLASRRTFILLLSALYFSTLHSFWPPISRTYLPIYPLVFVLGSGALLTVSDLLAASNWSGARIFCNMPLTLFVAIVEIAFLFAKPEFWHDHTKPETNLLRAVIALTGRDEIVLDCKGETVFRPRAFRPALERIEMLQVEHGLAIDNVVERCIETHTHVVSTLLSERFSPRTREFIQANYLPVGHDLFVAGKILRRSGDNSGRTDFDILVSAPYEITAREGAVAGLLDGTPYTGARVLAAGRHTFSAASNARDLVALWAQALDRGFHPRFKQIFPPSS